MKVLHVSPSIALSYGGPTHSLAGYAVAARTAGIEVSIAAPRCSAADVESFVARAGKTDLHLFPSLGTGGFATSPALIGWVRRSAASYDVVHVHGLFNPTSSLSARMALASSAATVIRPFGTLSRYTFHHRRTALKRAYFKLVERRNLRAADALHFTTERERNEADWHGIDFTARAYVIPPPSLDNPINAPRIDSISDGVKVLFLGRINPVKNLECLIDAWPLVHSKVPNSQLQVAGDGDPAYVAGLRERASRNGVDESIKFTGFVSGARKEQLLASASVFVLPSHHENFGVAALEAIGAGVPVVLSPDVHLADFVLLEGVGRVAAPRAESLAETIRELIGDEQARRHVRERGKEIVSRRFSTEVIGGLLSVMYRAAIERSGTIATS
ncbi:MAG TPA: glycosyltransferase [Rhodothermia bacterium]|nr:glycosyltransferase [Rhodothermia bacterium]